MNKSSLVAFVIIIICMCAVGVMTIYPLRTLSEFESGSRFENISFYNRSFHLRPDPYSLILDSTNLIGNEQKTDTTITGSIVYIFIDTSTWKKNTKTISTFVPHNSRREFYFSPGPEVNSTIIQFSSKHPISGGIFYRNRAGSLDIAEVMTDFQYYPLPFFAIAIVYLLYPFIRLRFRSHENR